MLVIYSDCRYRRTRIILCVRVFSEQYRNCFLNVDVL